MSIHTRWNVTDICPWSMLRNRGINPNEIGMNDENLRTFIRVAETLKVWIVVRGINPGALRFVGAPGYWPKLQDCKPKTADIGSVNQGLVMSPFTAPYSFTSTRRVTAKKLWMKFVAQQCGVGIPVIAKHDDPEYYFAGNSSKYEKEIGDSDSFTLKEGDMRFEKQVDRPSRPGENDWYDRWLNVSNKNGQTKYHVDKEGHLFFDDKKVYGDFDLKDVFKTPRDYLDMVVAHNKDTNGNKAMEKRGYATVHVHAWGWEKVRLEVMALTQDRHPIVNHGDEVRFAEHTEDELFVIAPENGLIQSLMYQIHGLQNKNRFVPQERCLRIAENNNSKTSLVESFYKLIGRDHINNSLRFPISNARG